jgi:hypothetical protein
MIAKDLRVWREGVEEYGRTSFVFGEKQKFSNKPTQCYRWVQPKPTLLFYGNALSFDTYFIFVVLMLF